MIYVLFYLLFICLFLYICLQLACIHHAYTLCLHAVSTRNYLDQSHQRLVHSQCNKVTSTLAQQHLPMLH